MLCTVHRILTCDSDHNLISLFFFPRQPPEGTRLDVPYYTAAHDGRTAGVETSIH